MDLIYLALNKHGNAVASCQHDIETPISIKSEEFCD